MRLSTISVANATTPTTISSVAPSDSVTRTPVGRPDQLAEHRRRRARRPRCSPAAPGRRSAERHRGHVGGGRHGQARRRRPAAAPAGASPSSRPARTAPGRRRPRSRTGSGSRGWTSGRRRPGRRRAARRSRRWPTDSRGAVTGGRPPPPARARRRSAVGRRRGPSRPGRPGVVDRAVAAGSSPVARIGPCWGDTPPMVPDRGPVAGGGMADRTSMNDPAIGASRSGGFQLSSGWFDNR